MSQGMRVPGLDSCHLSYCANIHAGESWDELFPNLKNALPKIKRLVCPDAPFGVGLRLSARAAQDLSAPKSLEEFREFLRENDLYVFTINAFPYGQFHGARIKENVYLPDWTDPKRLDYTNSLAELFAKILPDDMRGSVSTVPVAFKSRIAGDRDADIAARLIAEHACLLHKIENETGKTITLNLEPEPFCYISTTRQCVDFFKQHLFGSAGIEQVRRHCAASNERAEEIIRRHIGVCLDAAHMAVEFEEPRAAVAMLRDAGIGIGKVQLSAALQIDQPDSAALEELKAFDDGQYLHQVSVKSDSGVSRYLDLGEAIAAWSGDGWQIWRVHFHVPIFRKQFGAFHGTQDFLLDMLRVIKKEDACPHLEVETYTWEVLPERFRAQDVTKDIAMELLWAKEQLLR
jgi:hypothetical protein